MILKVSPDQGLWKGATFEFSIKVPDMYPHDPPKVHCNTLVSICFRSSCANFKCN